MKKTILMMVFAIVAMVAMPSKVMAANVAGDYVGKLTRVYMNKEKTPTDDEVIITGTYDAATNTLKYTVDCTGKYLLFVGFHAIVDFEGKLEN